MPLYHLYIFSLSIFLQYVDSRQPVQAAVRHASCALTNKWVRTIYLKHWIL